MTTFKELQAECERVQREWWRAYARALAEGRFVGLLHDELLVSTPEKSTK